MSKADLFDEALRVLTEQVDGEEEVHELINSLGSVLTQIMYMFPTLDEMVFSVEDDGVRRCSRLCKITAQEVDSELGNKNVTVIGDRRTNKVVVGEC